MRATRKCAAGQIWSADQGLRTVTGLADWLILIASLSATRRPRRAHVERAVAAPPVRGRLPGAGSLRHLYRREHRLRRPDPPDPDGGDHRRSAEGEHARVHHLAAASAYTYVSMNKCKLSSHNVVKFATVMKMTACNFMYGAHV